MPENFVRRPNTNCSVCEKPIYKRPCDMALGRFFCSKACHGDALRRQYSCVFCGIEIKRRKRSSPPKTCSIACSNKSRTGIKYKRLDDITASKSKLPKILRARLIKKHGELCSECGIGPVWNGKPLLLQVHHIDGVRNNNKDDNITLLCPNCHTQTESYARGIIPTRVAA